MWYQRVALITRNDATLSKNVLFIHRHVPSTVFKLCENKDSASINGVHGGSNPSVIRKLHFTFHYASLFSPFKSRAFQSWARLGILIEVTPIRTFCHYYLNDRTIFIRCSNFSDTLSIRRCKHDFIYLRPENWLPFYHSLNRIFHRGTSAVTICKIISAIYLGSIYVSIEMIFNDKSWKNILFITIKNFSEFVFIT